MVAPSENAKAESPGEDFSTPMDFEQFAEVNYTAINAAGEIGQQWIKMVNDVNGEFFRFVSTRLSEDAAIAPSLAGCRDSEDLFRVCSEFYRKAVSQYFDEAEKLAHIGAGFASQTTRLVENEVRDVHDIASD